MEANMKMNILSVIMVVVVMMSTGCATIPQQPSPSASIEPTFTPTPKIQKEAIKVTKNPIVTIEMDNGDIIKAELYPEIAQNTVCNFISLINKGFYNGVIFHRVIPGFMIQGGDPNGVGTGGPGYSIKGEFSANGFKNDLKHTRGVLSMARSQSMNSGGSQFFIMVKEYPSLDGQYASFGKVTEGLDAVDNIVNSKKDGNDKPLTEQKMKKVTVETFGTTYPEPETMK